MKKLIASYVRLITIHTYIHAYIYIYTYIYIYIYIYIHKYRNIEYKIYMNIKYV